MDSKIIYRGDTFVSSAFVADSGVLMYYRPHTQAEVVRHCAIGELLCVKKRAAGEKNRLWAYVAVDGENGLLFGWVLDYYLGYIPRFKRVQRCRRQPLVGFSGASKIAGQLSMDGVFKGSVGNATINQGGRIVGHLYRYMGLYTLRFATDARMFFFVKNEKGFLINKSFL